MCVCVCIGAVGHESGEAHLRGGPTADEMRPGSKRPRPGVPPLAHSWPGCQWPVCVSVRVCVIYTVPVNVFVPVCACVCMCTCVCVRACL